MIEILLVILFGWVLSVAINPKPAPVPKICSEFFHGSFAEESARQAQQAQLEEAMNRAQANKEKFMLQPFDGFYEGYDQ